MSVLIFLLLLSISPNTVLGERNDIHHMMYETFTNSAMCFRILNGTNQFGCSTPPSGKTGVVHFVNNEADIQWLLESSKAGPYIAAIPPDLFVKDVLDRLTNSPHVSGVLLAMNNSANRPSSMSPDDTCPNRLSSLANSCDDTSPWNPYGSGFLLTDWNVPLFVVKDPQVMEQIYRCFDKFNLPLETQAGRPLCSLQMVGHMYAAVDTPTCMRRSELSTSYTHVSFCDPMGDQNLVSTLFPRRNFTVALNNSVILLTARLDTGTMFDGLAPGAVSTVAGIVTLLTTAHLLSQLLPEYKQSYNKTIMFALLNGETQDYIGSSRIVYDMQQSKFPSDTLPVLLEHIDQVIDLNQLDITKKVYCHCFQSSTAQETVNALLKSSQSFGLTVEGSCSFTAKLPPSSLHSFIKANKSIPGIILSNHATQYTNMYYNGLLDNPVNVNFTYANGSQVPATSIQNSLASVAHTLALSLATLVDPTSTWPSKITPASTESLLDELLYCYLESRQCRLFRNVSGDSVTGEGPFPLYVGVWRSLNQVTKLTSLVFAQLTGNPTNLTEEKCSKQLDPREVDYHSLVWVGGDSSSGVCMETRIDWSDALSPAFVVDNYNWTSGEFSSWTESVWAELSLRMFLRPSFSQELTTLLSGLLVLVMSFLIVSCFKRNADLLFSPLPTENC